MRPTIPKPIGISVHKGALLNQEELPLISSDLIVQRSGIATRVNEVGIIEVAEANTRRFDYLTGSRLLLVESSAVNLQPNSENFSAFSKYNSVIISKVIISPSGTLTGDKLNDNNGTIVHALDGAIVNVSGVATVSIFAKKGELKYLRVYITDITYAVNYTALFNLELGTIYQYDSGVIATVINYGNGWFRCVVTYAKPGTSMRMSLGLQKDATATPQVYQGNGSGVYIWGAQVESGNKATSYIPTLLVSATRNSDLILLNIPSKTISISEIFDDGSINKITNILAVYQVSTGKIKSITISSNRALNPALGYNPIKYGVVLNRGVLGDFDSQIVESPAIFFDTAINKYHMVYTAYDVNSIGSIGHAISDNLVQWTKQGQLLSKTSVIGDPDQGGLTGPYIWYENGIYYFFYIGMTGTGYEAGIKTLCLATSTDFVTWTRLGAIISPKPLTWRNKGIYHPSIIKVGSIYYMFFNAENNEGLGERIGYATSTDLVTWTCDDINSPVLSRGNTIEWDGYMVGDPSVYKIGPTFFMMYFGLKDGGIAMDGVASTTESLFPLGWAKYDGNPVLTVGAAYDSVAAHKPFMFKTPNVLFHFYTAVGNAGRVIAMAYEKT